jgi:hypothetical protein
LHFASSSRVSTFFHPKGIGLGKTNSFKLQRWGQDKKKKNNIKTKKMSSQTALFSPPKAPKLMWKKHFKRVRQQTIDSIPKYMTEKRAKHSDEGLEMSLTSEVGKENVGHAQSNGNTTSIGKRGKALHIYRAGGSRKVEISEFQRKREEKLASRVALRILPKNEMPPVSKRKPIMTYIF